MANVTSSSFLSSAHHERHMAEVNEVLKKLARLLDKMTPHDGFFPLLDGHVNVTRLTKTSDESTCLLTKPSICIVPQGAKSVSTMQSDGHYVEDESTMVVYAAEVPINYTVTKASPEEPYFCLMIPLDAPKLNELIVKVFPNGVPKAEKTRSVYVRGMDLSIVKSAVRVLELIEQQECADLLVPLAIEEILIRLLHSSVGPSIVQIGVVDSHIEKVSKAISWLKDHYAEPIKTEQLAELTGMSVSSFHSHFKAITSMSPLQFQKTVRLQQARSLMRSQLMDVSRAAFEVGYVSSSQFSREYTRAFGVSPSKDALRARH